jgi:hypothetical protein
MGMLSAGIGQTWVHDSWPMCLNIWLCIIEWMNEYTLSKW